MKIVITNESGDWKEMLYTRDKITYEVKSQEIIEFFSKLNDAYNNDENIDDMCECLYNLINYGYLYTDTEYDNFDDDDLNDDYDYDDDDDYDYDDDDLDEDDFESEGIQLIESEVEYFVDGDKTTKDEYDGAWDLRIGYLGSSNWEEKGLCITNANTDEIIFIGKM